MYYLEAAGETAAGVVLVAAGEVLVAGALEVSGALEAAGVLEAAAGDTLVVGALEVAGEVEAAVLVVPQPAKAATSIKEAATTAIVFFMGFPPKINNIFNLETFNVFLKSC
jgi:hypothetical protein